MDDTYSPVFFITQFADKVLQLGQVEMTTEQLREQLVKLRDDMQSEENN